MSHLLSRQSIELMKARTRKEGKDKEYKGEESITQTDFSYLSCPIQKATPVKRPAAFPY